MGLNFLGYCLFQGGPTWSTWAICNMWGLFLEALKKPSHCHRLLFQQLFHLPAVPFWLLLLRRRSWNIAPRKLKIPSSSSAVACFGGSEPGSNGLRHHQVTSNYFCACTLWEGWCQNHVVPFLLKIGPPISTFWDVQQEPDIQLMKMRPIWVIPRMT